MAGFVAVGYGQILGRLSILPPGSQCRAAMAEDWWKGADFHMKSVCPSMCLSIRTFGRLGNSYIVTTRYTNTSNL